MPQQQTNQEPEIVGVLHELKGEVGSPEDAETLEAWKKEVGAERAAALSGLGKQALTELSDGSVVTHQEAQSIHASGEASHAYGTAGRRA